MRASTSNKKRFFGVALVTTIVATTLLWPSVEVGAEPQSDNPADEGRGGGPGGPDLESLPDPRPNEDGKGSGAVLEGALGAAENHGTPGPQDGSGFGGTEGK